MKKVSLFGALVLGATGVYAQSLDQAILKTDNERYAAAAADFKALIGKEPNKGDYYFYYGENFFKNGDLDSANIVYQKGVEVNASNPLNYVGLGKVLWFNGKEAEAKTQFFKAATLGNNKNAEVMRKTAEAYIDGEHKSVDEAIALLNSAIKLESKNPENYILMGDALLEKNPTDGGPAIKQYDKATDLNPKSPKGILRAGKLYQRGRNYPLALEYYKKAEGIDPNFAPAYREKAELYHMAGQDPKAIESYRKYLELNDSPEARYRYASFLFANKQYTDAIAEIEGLKAKGMNNLYLERMLGYSYAELGDKTDKDAYTKGLTAINNFFTQAGANANFKYLATDYKYKGLLLARTGSDSLGVLEIEKSIGLDSSKAGDLYGEIAKLYSKSKRYDKAIAYYNKKKGNDPKNLNSQDYFDLGRAYYYGPKDFAMADSSFAKVCEAAPTFPTGYYWRAKANVQLDPKSEKWLAKPYYEKYLELVKPEERTNSSYKSGVIEACEYLGYYYMVQKDNVKAKEYWTIVKELDPNNAKQKAFFAPPAPAKQPANRKLIN